MVAAVADLAVEIECRHLWVLDWPRSASVSRKSDGRASACCDIGAAAGPRRHGHGPGGTKASIFAVAKQAELRRIACGFCESEMAEGVRGQETSTRGALQVAALDQIRLDDVLDGIARLR